VVHLLGAGASRQTWTLMSVEQALGYSFSEAEQAAKVKVRTDADVVGGPELVAELLAGHVERSGADEIIATTNTFAIEDRLASYERLAEVTASAGRLPPTIAGMSRPS
jgi:hypothetical protein